MTAPSISVCELPPRISKASLKWRTARQSLVKIPRKPLCLCVSVVPIPTRADLRITPRELCKLSPDMSEIVDFRMGDLVRLRKPHPCGGFEWTIVRLGADIGLTCNTCGHRVLLERRTLEKRLKTFVSRGPEPDPEQMRIALERD